MPNLDFRFTPEEAQPIASAVARHYAAEGRSVEAEQVVAPDVGYRPTLTITRPRNRLRLYVEAQGRPEYHKALRQFVLWIRANRKDCEIYLATNEDSHLTLRELDEIRRDGVGVLRVGELETTVVVHEQPLNPAHTVTIHPDVRLGPYTEAVRAAVEKFNRQSQKNGLQDMCEIVERVTLSLLLKAVKKGYVNVTVTQATKMDWENRINALASPNRYQAGKTVLLDNDMKTDHLAFKNTRNLVDHARGRRENNQLTQQLVERMLMGQRLLGQLVTISRRIR